MIFLSYSHKNQIIADEIYSRLTSAGLDVWIDKIKLPKGILWIPEIDNVLSRMQAIVCLVTPESLESVWVTYEWAYAMGLHKGREQTRFYFLLSNIDIKDVHLKIPQYNLLKYPEQLDALLASLSDLHDPIQTPPFIKNIESELDNKQFEDRREAVLTLHFSDSSAALIALSRHLNHPDPKTLKLIAAAVSFQTTRFQLNEILPSLKTLLYSISHWEIRRSMLEAMEHLASPESVQAIEESLTLLDEPNLVEFAIGTLGNLKSRKSIPVVMPFLKDSNPQIIRTTALSLLKVGDASVLEPVVQVAINMWLSDTHDPKIRAYPTDIIVSGLLTFAAIYDSNAVSNIVYKLLVFQPDEYLKYRAIELLGKTGDSSYLSILDTLLADETFQKFYDLIDLAKKQIQERIDGQ